jgi:hypothetical protein
MAIRALDLMAKVSSRFAYEILPVATASVIGAMLVNHYGRQPAASPIVIQAQPSASEDAMVQSLREEHELIASFVKRREDFVKLRQEQEMDAERSASGSTQVASASAPPLSVVDPPLPDPRQAAQKAVARLAPKPAPKKSAAAETPSLPANLPAIPSETPQVPDLLPPPAQIEPESRAIVRLAGAVGVWVADVAQAPVRAVSLARLPDWTSLPPLIRPLDFFRQN